MENILQSIKDMHDILEHMHRIGDEWHTELVKLRADNQALQSENVRLQGLQKFIDARINSLHKNIDEKSSTVLAKIVEIHTKDIPATQAQIIGTKNSIAPLVEAKKFYDDKLAELKQKQAELEREEELNERESKLNEREKLLEAHEDVPDSDEKLSEAHEDIPDTDEKETMPPQNNHGNLEEML